MSPPQGQLVTKTKIVKDSTAPAVFITTMLTEDEGEAAIQKFCQFLRFPTVSSLAAKNGAYVECAFWLKNELERCTALDDVFFLPDAPEHSPVVVALWKGMDESLPVLLFNSHYDVVPAECSDWSVPPFEGLRQDGKIFGRGTQDMKCVCIQYIEAIAKLHEMKPEWKPARNIYLTFVPDEGLFSNLREYVPILTQGFSLMLHCSRCL